jgi:hypothetical protein
MTSIDVIATWRVKVTVYTIRDTKETCGIFVPRIV